jgi:hypothetical protein
MTFEKLNKLNIGLSASKASKMARFCGIKELYKKLPTLVLYIIYRFYIAKITAAAKELALEKLDKFKKYGAPLLQNTIVADGNRRYFKNRNFDYLNISFTDVSLEKPKIKQFKVVYDRTPPPNTPSARSGLMDLWIVLKYCSKANIFRIFISNSYDNYPLRFKKAWISMLSIAVCLLDKVFPKINPQTILLRIYKCTGVTPANYIRNEKASLRLVDAVRAATNKRIIEYELAPIAIA